MDDLLTQAIEFYRTGKSLGDVAAKFGMSAATWHRRFKAAGIECQSRGERIKGGFQPERRICDWDVVSTLYSEGHSVAAIAERLGVRNAIITHALRRLGIYEGRAETYRRKHLELAANGKTTATGHGYVTVYINNGRKQYEHILIAERALGRKLRKNERVHHIDGNRKNNANSNLLICSHAYHLALHARMRRHPYWSQI